MGSRILLDLVWEQKILLLLWNVILVSLKIPIPFGYEIGKTEVPDVLCLQYSLLNSLRNHFILFF